MSDNMVIQSHMGPYKVYFQEDALESLNSRCPQNIHYIIDQTIAERYAERMANILNSSSVLIIKATECSKSLEQFPKYVEHLMSSGFRRDHKLIAIGGGIIQDISCFLAATMMRGVQWVLYPTTLLSQADSCIGSKSSINAGGAKNIMGTFTPPNTVFISTNFLQTLDDRDVRSGVGEILKVHAIDGPLSFDQLAKEYDKLFVDPEKMIEAIQRALQIKKNFVEEDEFDRGPRNIFNYGHSFGHAIEAAAKFEIPHGIAVTMGMDMANFISQKIGVGTAKIFQRMHPTLKANFKGYETHPVPMNDFVSAISKDKKNIGTRELTLILPDQFGQIIKTRLLNNTQFSSFCTEYLNDVRLS